MVAAAVAGRVLCPVATSSGEELEQQVGDPGEHAELGDQLIWFVLPLLVLTAGPGAAGPSSACRRRQRHLRPRRRPRRQPGRRLRFRPGAAADHGSTGATAPASTTASTSPTVVKVVAALAIIAGLATTVQVYRVGDSGARAAWGDQVSSSSGSGSGESGD